MNEYPVTERFDRFLREFGSLVAEAQIYGAEGKPGEFLQLVKLADHVAGAIYPWAVACGYTWDQLEAMGTEVDAVAVGRVSPGGWGTDQEISPFDR